jgi:serine/threonine protein kinase
MSSLPPEDDDRTVIRPKPKSPTEATPEPATKAAVDNGPALPVGTFLGEFELTSMLGVGGFGIVYLAWDHSLERRVALKEYMPSSLAMRGNATEVLVKSERHRETFDAGMKSFINEARLLAQFDHPSLVKVYRFWEANETAYMVMPFYEGVTLKDRLKEMDGPPDEAWLMGLLAPLTEALQVIHNENCFHRDIAPDNVILLAGSGKPLLLDFGAARRVIGDMTQALTVILKPGYAPVEQYAEAPGMHQGAWTDIYALAASVYFAILGKTPPPSVSRLIKDDYVPLAQSCAGRFSPGFLSAIDQALEVRPEQRTQSIEAFRASLGLSPGDQRHPETRLRTAAAGPSDRAGFTQPAKVEAAHPANAPRRTGLWIVLGLIGVVLAAGAAYMALSHPPAAPEAARKTPGAGAAPPDTTLSPSAPAALPSAAPTPSRTPATLPPTSPTPAPQGFDVSAEFDRVMGARTAGFEVEAAPTLANLRIDKDNLSFTVKSSRDGFVTVLVLGPDGSLTRLIPSKDIPIVKAPAGRTITLPQGVAIGTAEPTGLEQFLVLVSAYPRDYAPLSTRSEGGYLALPTGPEALQKVKQLPADQPPLLGLARDCSAGTAACNDFGAARFDIQVVR